MASVQSEAGGSEAGARVRAALWDLFEVRDVTLASGGLVRLRGRLLRPSDEAYALAAERLQPLGYTPVLRRRDGDDVLEAWPRLLRAKPGRPWINLLLFVLTALSVLFIPAVSTLLVAISMGADLRRGLPGPLVDVPFAATLLTIMLAHEFGHYLVGRHYGMVSLPYFIPLPGSPFGTLGAVIHLKAPPRDRRVLLAVAAAGPLAGLAAALPLLVLGLRLSQVGPIPPYGAVLEGNSLLYAAIKFLMFGRLLPSGGLDVNLHSVAFAAWGGLFLTGFNLMPAGQLDGGHIAYVLVGERARQLSLAVVVGLIVLGLFAWPGWFLTAGLVFVFGQTYATPLDDITRLRPWQALLAAAMLIVFALTFTPIPLTAL
ncbi:MAG: site-2 protease family protein [Anaerolineae bacterium]|nr:site-2 protease family protein [Anaerolineae bacterium]